jgi:DNA uptake protein ComE-like DNA-binding protein
MFTAKGVQGEWAFGEHGGHHRAAVASSRGSAAEAAHLERASKARQQSERKLGEFSAERAAAADLASTVASTVISGAITLASAGTATPVLMAIVGGLSGEVAGQLAEASVNGWERFNTRKAAREVALALAKSLLKVPLKSVGDAAAGGAKALVPEALLDALAASNPGLATVLDKAGKEVIMQAVKKYPNDLLKGAFLDPTFFREGMAERLDQPALEEASTILVQALLKGASDTLAGDEISDLKESGAWDEHLAAAVLKGTADLALATAAQKAIQGKALEDAELVKLLCKVADIAAGVRADQTPARASAVQTLEWLNTATPADLRRAGVLDRSTVDALVTERESRGSFTSLGDVFGVAGMRDELTDLAPELDTEGLLTTAPVEAKPASGGFGVASQIANRVPSAH